MGLVRRPTTSKIVVDGRLGRPCGPGAHSRASKTQVAAAPPFRHSTRSVLPPHRLARDTAPRLRLAPVTAAQDPPVAHRAELDLLRSAAATQSTEGRGKFAGRAVGGWLSRHLGVCHAIQYGRSAMRVNRQQQATRASLVLALVLVSLWTGSLTAPSAGNPADHLATNRPQSGLQPAALRDSAPALRPAAERPGPQGRLVPLLAILAAAVADAYRWRSAARRRGLARAGSRAWPAPLEARAPPRLQPA
jgi:hypothetical protein